MKTEERIKAAEEVIAAHGFTVHYVEYCEDAETPGLLGAYAGVTIREKQKVKVSIKGRSRKEIADIIEHESRHVENALWDCGSGGGVLGQESAAAARQRDARPTKVKDLRKGMVTPWYVILEDPEPHPSIATEMQMRVRYSDTGEEGLCRGLAEEEVPAL